MVEVIESNVKIIPVGKYEDDEFEELKQIYLDRIKFSYANASSCCVINGNSIEFSNGKKLKIKR